MKAMENVFIEAFATKEPRSLEQVLLDPSTPTSIKFRMIYQILESEDGAGMEVLRKIIDAAASGDAKNAYNEKTKELARLLQQMSNGHLRVGTFDTLIEDGQLGRRAQVILGDGQLAFVVVADDELAGKLECGDTVWMDAQYQVLLDRSGHGQVYGEEGKIERLLPGGEVEVSIGELGRYVFRAARELRAQLEAGTARPGSTVIVCQRRMFAFHALPAPDESGHMRFLSREAVPSVVAERDLGAPPAFIEELGQHVRRELSEPGLSTRYRLRRSLMRLLTGAPGTGKSFSIQAAWNLMYRVMSEVTGVAVMNLPQRVMHLRSWEVNSKWFGSTDRNIAKFFDELEVLAAEPFVAPDGRVWFLPVLMIAEEIDALARSRGEDSIHDRILATLLQRLDPSRDVFRESCICVLATTNTPELVDRAIMRRIGGAITRFGDADRHVFKAVLSKQVAGRPFQAAPGSDPELARARAIDDLTAWLFSPNSTEPALVELTYVGQTSSVRKFRRDFITPALVDRAVQEASERACSAEWQGHTAPGLSTGLLMASLDSQVRSVVGLLRPENCATYLTLPDGVRVSRARRLAQPAVTALELERVS